MKGKTKQEKAITLIALIITIVILLILAVVAINSITEQNIIKYAGNASETYNNSVQNEQNTFQGYVNYLENNTGLKTYKVGDTVEYDSNKDGKKEDWIVLTSEEGLLEIVSAKAMGNLTLGYYDKRENVTTDLDGDGTVGDYEDRAIASYNKAITTINNYCKSLVTATDNEGVRSVGASSDTAEDYSSTNFNKWFKNSSTVKVKAGDEYYKTDFDKMVELGIADVDSVYWMASRNVKDRFDAVSFGVRLVNTSGVLDDYFLWCVYPGGAIGSWNTKYAVRPVVINPSGI